MVLSNCCSWNVFAKPADYKDRTKFIYYIYTSLISFFLIYFVSESDSSKFKVINKYFLTQKLK